MNVNFKKNVTAVLCVMLVLVFIVSSLAACGETESQESSSAAASAVTSKPDGGDEETSVDMNDRKNAKDSLPDKNFDNETFTILQRSELSYEFKPSEDESDRVSELIANRNSIVEERFGVKIETIEVAGSWGVHEDFIKYIRNTISGGTVDYDLIAGYAAIMPSAISDDCFLNWYDVPYIDFEADWWAQDFIDQMTLNDSLYLISGDIALTFWDSMTGMFFNKNLAKTYNLDLYNLVRDHEWTFDKMHSVIKENYIDDTNLETKIYGYATAYTTQIDVYQDAFDIPVTTKDSDGKPYYTINCEKTYNALEMVYDLVVGTPYTYKCADQDETTVFFGKGRALFAPLALSAGATLRNYDTEYGILPMPLFNTEQDTYNSTCQDNYSVFAIPSSFAGDEEKLSFIGIITEALCAESYRSVIPEYYQTILQLRYTSDDDSIEMIEIIREGILCNFGYLFSYTLDWPAHQLNVCINNGTKSFISNWESKESAFNVNLEKILEFFFDD